MWVRSGDFGDLEARRRENDVVLLAAVDYGAKHEDLALARVNYLLLRVASHKVELVLPDLPA